MLQFSGKIDYISSISQTNVLLDVPSVPDDQLAKVGVDTPDSRTTPGCNESLVIAAIMIYGD